MKETIDDVILTQCACGVVRDIDGTYITEEIVEERYKDRNVIYSHGTLSLECMEKYYGFVPKGYSELRISCDEE